MSIPQRTQERNCRPGIPWQNPPLIGDFRSCRATLSDTIIGKFRMSVSAGRSVSACSGPHSEVLYLGRLSLTGVLSTACITTCTPFIARRTNTSIFAHCPSKDVLGMYVISLRQGCNFKRSLLTSEYMKLGSRTAFDQSAQ